MRIHFKAAELALFDSKEGDANPRGIKHHLVAGKPNLNSLLPFFNHAVINKRYNLIRGIMHGHR